MERKPLGKIPKSWHSRFLSDKITYFRGECPPQAIEDLPLIPFLSER
jgi:hypothetical protein